MSKIPEDVILKGILPKLPIKSLLRFRCVSKQWNSFILDPVFLQLRHHHIVFACRDLTRPHRRSDDGFKISFPIIYTAPLSQHQRGITPPAASSFVVANYLTVAVETVNGFLCIHPKCYYYTTFSSSIHVFNPTTRQLIELPGDTLRDDHKTIGTHFGYDPLRDEFMVLRLTKNFRRGARADDYQFRILTVGGADSWTNIELEPLVVSFNPMICFSVARQKSVCVNGALYWTHKSEKLVSFGLRNKQFRAIALPRGYEYIEDPRGFEYNEELPSGMTKYKELVELGGCLTVIGYSECCYNLNLWVLKDFDSEVWVKESIRFPCVIDSPCRFVWEKHLICPLGKINTGEILLMPYFLGKKIKAYYYDMERRSFRSIVIAKFPHRWLPEKKKLVIDTLFCQENFRILMTRESSLVVETQTD